MQIRSSLLNALTVFVSFIEKRKNIYFPFMSANINLTVQNVVVKVVKILGGKFLNVSKQGSSKKKYRVLDYFQRRTKTTKFQGANRPEILWFWSKWV